MKCAADGDRVSRDIVKRGADQIVHLLATCAKELGMQRGGYRVAATGGLVEKGGTYFDLVRKGLKKVHPKSDLVIPRFEPVIGAALIALDVVGVKWTEELLQTVEKSSKRTRPKRK
jgi:N-acetylglucosamine kinase-like BadF-type ATPase